MFYIEALHGIFFPEKNKKRHSIFEVIQTKHCALSVMQYFHQGLTSLVCKLEASDLQRSQSKLELSMQKQHKDTSSSFASAESDLGQGNLS